MPPRRKQKSAEEKKKDAVRQKRILSTKEKILSLKRMILSKVEVMIQKDVSKDWFLENCSKLCHADYDDVIQERSIEQLCGYVLCNNIIKKSLKQKYHISPTTNKVYDLTERKFFCSNHCFKASNYVRAQLSPIPIYLRKEEAIKVQLLSDCDNRGSMGEEIVFQQKITENEINVDYNKGETSNCLKDVLSEEVKKCADFLDNLQIKEHVFEKQYTFCATKSDNSFEDKKESISGTDDDSENSSDEELNPSYDNDVVLSNRHIPVPEKTKRAVLIPPLNSNVIHVPVKPLSLDFIINVFKDWMTEDSMKYLLGEKYVYGVKADHLFQTMTSTDESLTPEKLSTIKSEYIKLCLKIDSLPDEDSDISDSIEFDLLNGPSSNSVSNKSVNNSRKKAFKRRPKEKLGKKVTFAPEIKEHSEEVTNIKTETGVSGTAGVLTEEVQTVPGESHSSHSEKKIEIIDGKDTSLSQRVEKQEQSIESSLPPEPLFPLVDSVAQNALRKQILTSKLKSIYTELLPVVGLHYTDVREAVRKFVDTLSLTPTNVIFKPKEWKLISVVLLRVLTKCVLLDILDESQFVKLYKNPMMPTAIDDLDIERIVSCIISENNIINVQ